MTWDDTNIVITTTKPVPPNAGEIFIQASLVPSTKGYDDDEMMMVDIVIRMVVMMVIMMMMVASLFHTTKILHSHP